MHDDAKESDRLTWVMTLPTWRWEHRCRPPPDRGPPGAWAAWPRAGWTASSWTELRMRERETYRRMSNLFHNEIFHDTHKYVSVVNLVPFTYKGK